jgi:hypothetical protein
MTLHAPWTRPLPHLGLELVVLLCAVATLAHALRAARGGDRLPLFTWASIFVYGLAIELVSYNFIKSFTHAQFTVMFYDQKLPLYVTAVYPVLLYTGIATARRFALRWPAEAVAAGVLIVALDVPFDVLGPVVGWWRWSDTDPNLAVRWLDVPVTSYYWHLSFGAALCALTRLVGPRRFWLAPVVGVLTIVAGFIAFVPFHLLKAAGLPDGVFVAVALALAAAVVAVAALRPPRAGADRLLLGIAAAFYAFHLVIALAYGSPAALAVVLAVTALAALAHARGHLV